MRCSTSSKLHANDQCYFFEQLLLTFLHSVLTWPLKWDTRFSDFTPNLPSGTYELGGSHCGIISTKNWQYKAYALKNEHKTDKEKIMRATSLYHSHSQVIAEIIMDLVPQNKFLLPTSYQLEYSKYIPNQVIHRKM